MYFLEIDGDFSGVWIPPLFPLRVLLLPAVPELPGSSREESFVRADRITVTLQVVWWSLRWWSSEL